MTEFQIFRGNHLFTSDRAYSGYLPCLQVAASLLDDSRVGLARHGVIAAVQRHDTAAIFDWLIDALSYQGVSDNIAWDTWKQHGRVRWRDIATALAGTPSCPKLRCYWTFADCGYRKGAGSCANPNYRTGCPFAAARPAQRPLNQTAYSLFLFLRYVADGDFVGWIRPRLAAVDPAPTTDRPAQLAGRCSNRSAHLRRVEQVWGWRSLSYCSAVMRSGRSDRSRHGDDAIRSFLGTQFPAPHWYLRDLQAEHSTVPAATLLALRGDHRAHRDKIDARRFNPAYPGELPALR